MVIDRLLSYSEPLKEAYQVFHDITNAFREKDAGLFFDIIRSMSDKINPEFRHAIQNLDNHEVGIRKKLFSKLIIGTKHIHGNHFDPISNLSRIA